MKKISFIYLLGVFLLSACSHEDEPEMRSDGAASQRTVSEVSSDKVSLSTVQALIASGGVKSRSGKISADISCIKNGAKDTLFYVVDKPGGGWIIYATDKRVSPVVASSDNGTFKEASSNANFLGWLDYMGKCMSQAKRQADASLRISAADIEANRNFWLSVEDPISYMCKVGAITLPPTLPKDSLKYYGHYELVSTATKVEVVDEIQRLTTTDWNQTSWTNAACPYKSNGETRCPAGCVAIAAGQMMYFLHSKYNVPAKIPSQAYCNSKYNEKPYDWAQYNYTSEVWNTIDEYGLNSAPLIADIGRRVNTQYGEEASGAYTGDLKAMVFAPYGISCNFMSFNTSNLSQNLLNKMPVIVAMGDINDHSSRHTFICDRYRRSKTVTTRIYEWVYDRYPENDDGTLILVPTVEDKVEVVQTMPYVSAVGFNWGWGPLFNNPSEWFSISGPWSAGGSDYGYDGYMVTDFAVMN